MLLTESETNTVQSQVNHSRLRVLVLCTGNSARSIMAEAIFNTVGSSLFQAYSAGSHPTGNVNPLALEQISQLNLPSDMRMRSKSCEEFIGQREAEIDVVLTVCDSAVAEVCPTSFGRCTHIHWGLPDPAGASDILEEERGAFFHCFEELKKRVESLVTRQRNYADHAALIQAMEDYQCTLQPFPS